MTNNWIGSYTCVSFNAVIPPSDLSLSPTPEDWESLSCDLCCGSVNLNVSCRSSSLPDTCPASPVSSPSLPLAPPPGWMTVAAAPSGGKWSHCGTAGSAGPAQQHTVLIESVCVFYCVNVYGICVCLCVSYLLKVLPLILFLKSFHFLQLHLHVLSMKEGRNKRRNQARWKNGLNWKRCSRCFVREIQ